MTVRFWTETGNIIFENGKQRFGTTNNGLLFVSFLSHSLYNNCSGDFVWEKCERKDLKPGDIAYRTNLEVTDKKCFESQPCAIIDNENYWHISQTGSILKSSLGAKNWFKLIEKSNKKIEEPVKPKRSKVLNGK